MSVAMSEGGSPIVLSDEDECVDLTDSDDEVEVVGSSWTCAVCKNINSQYAGDCTECGAAPDAEPPVDLEPPVDKGIDPGEALEEYLRSSTGSKALLDACGCSVHREALRAHVSELAGRMPGEPDGLAAHFACPQCGRELTRRDLVWALGHAACAEVDERCFEAVAAAVEAGSDGGGGGNRSKKARVQPHAAVGVAQLAVSAIESARRSMGVKGRREQANGQAGGGRGRGRGGRAQGGRGGGVGGRGIPKGTGYGGSQGRHNQRVQDAAPAAELARARQQEGAADAQTTAALEAIVTSLEEPCRAVERDGNGAGPPGASSGGRLRRRSAPLLLACAVHGSSLAFLLRRLLQNDSLLDIGQRDRLYWAAVKLLQFLGKCPEFALLLLQPAADPCDADPAGAPSVLAALKSLDTQCSVLKRSADDLHSEEENKALGLALEIGSVFSELQKAEGALRGSAEPQAGEPGSGREGGGDASAEERRYCEAMGPFRFRHWPMVMLKDFYFRKQQEAAGGGGLKRNQLRLVKEVSSLATSVPVSLSSSVLLVADEARMDMLRACIIGPARTPYENGAFVFDIWLPPAYPEVPPKVQFLTTGGGRVRFNPNLYDCGKVCLSLLGTWHGPSWDPNTSTILQVLVSIQSMIFVDDPYFNEPGYESSANTASGRAQAESYNRSIRRHTLGVALLPALRKPPAAFKEALQVHFQLKKAAILKQMDEWVARDMSLGAMAAEVREILAPSE